MKPKMCLWNTMLSACVLMSKGGQGQVQVKSSLSWVSPEGVSWKEDIWGKKIWELKLVCNKRWWQGEWRKNTRLTERLELLENVTPCSIWFGLRSVGFYDVTTHKGYIAPIFRIGSTLVTCIQLVRALLSDCLSVYIYLLLGLGSVWFFGAATPKMLHSVEFSIYSSLVNIYSTLFVLCFVLVSFH